MATINPTYLNNYADPHGGKSNYLRLTITNITQTDGGTNKTTVDWKITIEGSAWVTLHRAYCSLGGVVLYDGKPGLSNWRTGHVLASGSTTFNNASDGSLTLYAYIKQMFYYGNGDSTRWTNPWFYQENAVNMVCSTIPRYFSTTPSLVYTGGNETQLFYSWSTSEVCQVYDIEYRVHGQGNYVRYDTLWSDSTSGTFTISGLASNTWYDIRLYCRRKDSQMLSYSNQLQNLTYNIPHFTSLPNFVIGDELTVTFYNPLKRKVLIQLFYDDGSTNGTDIVTTESLSGWKVQACVDLQYASIPNKRKGRYTARIACDDLGLDTTVAGGEYSIRGNEVPIFEVSNIINVKDTLHVDDITGNASKIIKGHNNVTGEITKMTAIKGAGGKRYVVSANAQPNSQELLYDGGATKTFSFSNIVVNTFTVTAFDTRELSTPKNKTIDLVDYNKPIIRNFNINRIDGIGSYATISADGICTFWAGWDEIKKYNTIQKVYLRYKASTENTYSDWIDITDGLTTNNNGAWALNKTLDIIFNNATKYNVQLYIEDVLEGSEIKSAELSTANAYLWRDIKNKRLGINKKPEKTLDVAGDANLDGALYIKGVKVIWYD